MTDQLKQAYYGIQYAISRHLSTLQGNPLLQTKWVDKGNAITDLFDLVEQGSASAARLQMLMIRTQNDLYCEQVFEVSR